MDHEHVLDSDSILSMIYLPRSLTILGGGVIVANIVDFCPVGRRGHIIDRAKRPLPFMDHDIVDVFQRSIERQGRTVLFRPHGHRGWPDGVSSVVASLANGMAVKSEKMLVALGRQPNVEGLNLRRRDCRFFDERDISL